EWLITPEEIADRVRNLRAELESFRNQIEAVPFDIPSGEACEPSCLDGFHRKWTHQLVEDLNPSVMGMFEMIDEYARKHGCAEVIDFNAKLWSLKDYVAETGFRIGVLAGVMFAGSSKDQVDRFER